MDKEKLFEVKDLRISATNDDVAGNLGLICVIQQQTTIAIAVRYVTSYQQLMRKHFISIRNTSTL